MLGDCLDKPSVQNTPFLVPIARFDCVATTKKGARIHERPPIRLEPSATMRAADLLFLFSFRFDLLRFFIRTADGDLTRLHGFGNLAHEVDVQQSVF